MATKAQQVPAERPGPPDGPRARNRRRRLQQLRDAALPLFIDRGIERVTIDDIVGQAGVAKGSFYRYYPDKAALVAAIIEPVATALFSALDECLDALANAKDWDALTVAYQVLGLRLAPTMIEHRNAVLLYLQENRAPAIGPRCPVRALSDALADRAIAMTEVARHTLRRDVPAEISALTVIGAVERLTFEYLAGGRISDPLAAGQGLVTTILDGLRLQS